MLANQRIIHDDNGTLKDLSIELNDIFTGTASLPVVAAEDKLYIGSDLPFNHRWFEVSTANDQASTISVEIWDGNNWNSAVDITDYTLSGGNTLSQSGYIRWAIDRNNSFGREDSTEDITELTTLRIFDMYWVRLTFSGDLNVATAAKYMGFKFADDDDLGGYYPDLNQSATKTAFESGKTDWNEQHFLAAEEIIRHLRKKGIIWTRNQILDWEQFNLAGIHKVAELIMNAFGDDFEENRKLAKNKFFEAINMGIFKTDRDEDGRLDEREIRPFQATLARG